jgi:S-adenosylmethionine decarboxylase
MKRLPTRNYGQMLIIDGYGAKKDSLRDVNLLYSVLCRLPQLIGMTRVGFPHIIQFTKGELEGLSGFTFIVESHISVHTYVKQRFISIDVYSCKNFSPQTVVEFFRNTFQLESLKSRVLVRGEEFPVLAGTGRQKDELSKT